MATTDDPTDEKAELSTKQALLTAGGGITSLAAIAIVGFNTVLRPINSKEPDWLHVSIGAVFVLAGLVATVLSMREVFFRNTREQPVAPPAERVGNALRALFATILLGSTLIVLHDWLHKDLLTSLVLGLAQGLLAIAIAMFGDFDVD